MHGSNAFDARRLLLDQSTSSPRAAWPTVAILYGLRRDLLSIPWLADDVAMRTNVIEEALEALEGRGFDVDALIRFGLGDRLERAVVAGVAAYEALRFEAAVAGELLAVRRLTQSGQVGC